MERSLGFDRLAIAMKAACESFWELRLIAALLKMYEALSAGL